MNCLLRLILSGSTGFGSFAMFWCASFLLCWPTAVIDGGSGGDDARAGIHRLTVQATGPVRRTHQRTREHPGEADVVGLVAELHELLGLHPALDGVVPHGRAEVLGDGDELAARVVQVLERL